MERDVITEATALLEITDFIDSFIIRKELDGEDVKVADFSRYILSVILVGKADIVKRLVERQFARRSGIPFRVPKDRNSFDAFVGV